MYSKSEITSFAKDCAWTQKRFLDSICMAEEICHSAMGQRLLKGTGMDENLLLDISRCFAKLANDGNGFDVDTGEVQSFQNMVNQIIDCCEEHNWFHEKCNE